MASWVQEPISASTKNAIAMALHQRPPEHTAVRDHLLRAVFHDRTINTWFCFETAARIHYFNLGQTSTLADKAGYTNSQSQFIDQEKTGLYECAKLLEDIYMDKFTLSSYVNFRLRLPPTLVAQCFMPFLHVTLLAASLCDLRPLIPYLAAVCRDKFDMVRGEDIPLPLLPPIGALFCTGDDILRIAQGANLFRGTRWGKLPLLCPEVFAFLMFAESDKESWTRLQSQVVSHAKESGRQDLTVWLLRGPLGSQKSIHREDLVKQRGTYVLNWSPLQPNGHKRWIDISAIADINADWERCGLMTLPGLPSSSEAILFCSLMYLVGRLSEVEIADQNQVHQAQNFVLDTLMGQSHINTVALYVYAMTLHYKMQFEKCDLVLQKAIEMSPLQIEYRWLRYINGLRWSVDRSNDLKIVRSILTKTKDRVEQCIDENNNNKRPQCLLRFRALLAQVRARTYDESLHKESAETGRLVPLFKRPCSGDTALTLIEGDTVDLSGGIPMTEQLTRLLTEHFHRWRQHRSVESNNNPGVIMLETPPPSSSPRT